MMALATEFSLLVWVFSLAGSGLETTSCSLDLDGKEQTATDADRRVTITSSKTRYLLFEPITISVWFESQSVNPIRVYRTAPFFTCECELLDTARRTVAPSRLLTAVRTGDSGAFVTVASGKRHEEKLDLSRLYDLSVPGKYRLRVPTGAKATDPETERMSNALEFEIIDDERLLGAIRNLVLKPVTVSGDEHHGYQLSAELRGTEFASGEPIELTLKLTNVSAEPTGGTDGKPWRAARYEISVPRHFGLTRFGASHAICDHLVDRALAKGEVHEDWLVLNRFVDMTPHGEYEVRIDAVISTDKKTGKRSIVSAGPFKLKIDSKAWIPPRQLPVDASDKGSQNR